MEKVERLLSWVLLVDASETSVELDFLLRPEVRVTVLVLELELETREPVEVNVEDEELEHCSLKHCSLA